MPLLGFKKQFADLVERGRKRQTIRAKRRDGKNPHPGEKLFLYTGLRTKSCKKLGEAVCRSVSEISIDPYGINISGQWLSITERDVVAMDDGFDDFTEMVKFFRKTHEIFPFYGLLIKW